MKIKLFSKNGKLKEKNLVAVMIVIILTALVILESYIQISRLTEKQCLERMQEAVNTVMGEVNQKLGRDSALLNTVAQIIGMESDYNTPTMQNIISEFSDLMSANSISLLLPGDVVISTTGQEMDVSGKISFDREAVLGEHVTNREISVMDNNMTVIRHFIPIKQGEETVALLYGTTRLPNLPDMLNLDNIYNATAGVYLVDRGNGDLLMNTIDANHLGNIRDYENLTTQGNETMSQAIDKLLAGETGYIVYRSEEMDEYRYFYYAPLDAEDWQLGGTKDINQWSVVVTVPRKAALSSLYDIRMICYILALIEAVILLLYYFWAMRNTTLLLDKIVLQERLKKAENAERAKTMFLSNMSHDIRTPMNAIIGYTTLAVSNIDDKERVKDYLSKTLSSSNHLLSLINDVLDMSRIESGKIDLVESECSLPELFRDLRNILSNQMQAKQLSFYIDTIDVLDEDVYCDKLHLNQVLLNLLSNAMKFTPAGGSVSLVFKQKHGAPEGYAAYEIKVKDTGVGMSPEFMEHVFEPFEREKTSTISGIQGTGLGMAISKNIVDMMGGTISVQSEQGKGTEFTLNLQFRLLEERKQVEIIKELEGLRALVVDDDYNICDSVSKMLIQLGMRAEWTMHGKEAVLRAKQAVELADDFNAYVIDLMLPDLNGLEVVRRIRKEIGESIPIIVLTAYDWSNIEDEAREAGVTVFCNKPIFLSTLRNTLLSAIGQYVAEEKAENVSLNLEGRRILLVEDNELNREIAQEVLEERGLIIETAEDGSIAVDMVKASEAGYYDLILMDVQMPIMNGYEATKAIRNLEDSALASIPIIAMTANAFDEDKKQALESGMNDHVAKPIDIDKLEEALRKYLSN